MQYVSNGKLCVRMAEGVWGLSELSAQLFCKTETSLKNAAYLRICAFY